MATVVLLRHGRTSANTAGILAGRSAGVHLDDLGKEPAARAAERLASVPLAAVVSSPLERCVETARAVLGRQPVPLRMHREKGIAEVDYGVWTGKELKALAKEQLWRGVQGHPAGVTFPEGESMAGMSARSVAAVRRWDAQVAAEHGDDATWLAVSHGDVIKAVLADALGMHLDVFQRIVVDPASISVVRYTPGRPFVAMVNTTAGDLAHLAPPRPKRKGRRRRTTGDAAVGGGAGPEAAEASA
jgi:probable phosphomutase (TIGR03848 family)